MSRYWDLGMKDSDFTYVNYICFLDTWLIRNVMDMIEKLIDRVQEIITYINYLIEFWNFETLRHLTFSKRCPDHPLPPHNQRGKKKKKEVIEKTHSHQVYTKISTDRSIFKTRSGYICKRCPIGRMLDRWLECALATWTQLLTNATRALFPSSRRPDWTHTISCLQMYKFAFTRDFFFRFRSDAYEPLIYMCISLYIYMRANILAGFSIIDPLNLHYRSISISQVYSVDFELSLAVSCTICWCTILINSLALNSFFDALRLYDQTQQISDAFFQRNTTFE